MWQADGLPNAAFDIRFKYKYRQGKRYSLPLEQLLKLFMIDYDVFSFDNKLSVKRYKFHFIFDYF